MEKTFHGDCHIWCPHSETAFQITRFFRRLLSWTASSNLCHNTLCELSDFFEASPHLKASYDSNKKKKTERGKIEGEKENELVVKDREDWVILKNGPTLVRFCISHLVLGNNSPHVITASMVSSQVRSFSGRIALDTRCFK